MKTILSPHLTLTSFCLPVDGKLRRFFTISLSFSLLAPGGENVLSEEKGWQAAAEAVEEGAPIDLGVPKARPEWLLAGAVQSREPVGAVECAMRVDTQERRFLVAGDREDNGLDLARPLPFTSMPLVWSRAFGGKDVAENPIGRGVEKENDVVRLPNVTEKVGGALLDKTPACPGPMPSLHRQFANLGTFDTAWLKNNWPGPPSDFDWSFFNLAQGAQRRDTPFVGNEAIILTNLHPEHQVLQSTLPGLRLRLFLNLGSEDSPLWQEVETVADTVWLFPNQAVGMQLWHAACPTSDEKSSEICQAAALYEPCEGPRKTLPELFAALEAAKAGEMTGEEAARAEPDAQIPVVAPMPGGGVPEVGLPEVGLPDAPQPEMPAVPGPPPLPDDPVQRLDMIMAEAKKDVAEVLDAVNPALVENGFQPLTVDQVLAQMDKKQEAMKKMLLAPRPDEAQILQKAGFSQKQLDNLAKAADLTPPMRSNFVSNEAYEAALKAYGDEFAALTNASPKIRDKLLSQVRLIDQLQSGTATAEALAPKAPDLGKILQKAGLDADTTKLDAALAGFDTMQPGDASMMSFMQELGLALGIDPDIMTGQLTRHLSIMRSMAYKEGRFQSALERVFANFPDEKHVLPLLRKNIEAAKVGTSFDLKSLAQDAGITNEELLEAITAIDPLPIDPPMPPTPENAVQDETMAQDGEDSSSAEAPESANDKEISEDEISEDEISEDEISEDEISENGIPETEPVLDYTGQNLAGTSFAGMPLANARFDDANLAQADFSGANLEGASFANADLSNATLAGALLANADFTGARLEGANLSSCKAADATFDRAVFARTNLGGATLIHASFHECAAAGADFSGCDLARASFSGATLDGASFAGAKLVQTDFTACTLVRADFSRADMERARMYDNTLDHCVFFKARAQESSWLRCRGESPNLREAELAKATFDDCALVRADLGAVGARECRFHSCDLHGTDLRHADFLNGALRDCKLGGANLSGASLFACDLLYAAVNEETNLQGANIERTRLAWGEL